VARYLADPDARAAMARRAREAVLAAHTFDHRAATLLADLEPLLTARRAAEGHV
jgi:spore maturation protein CgeB